MFVKADSLRYNFYINLQAFLALQQATLFAFAYIDEFFRQDSI